jgi:hypothetical protein
MAGANPLGALGGAGGAGGAGGTGGSADASIQQMQAAFDKAIETSTRVTTITTEKKAQLDAAKQRPQN